MPPLPARLDGPLLDDVTLALVLYTPSVVLGAMYLGPMFSMTQGLVKLRMRALASAVLLFIINIIGLGAGPQMVGIVNDLLDPTYGQEAIRYSLLLVALAGLLGGVLFALASRTLREDLAARDA